jgi:MFS family permease
MQGVLFSWLLVGELHAPAELVGTAQMVAMLPTLALLLVGGAAADRYDRRRMLVGLHLVNALLVATLAAVVASGHLSYAALIAFALGTGTVPAFVMPARDSLLSEVAGGDLMRAVTGMTMVQFGMQAIGALLGGSGRWLGSAAALGMQAAVLAAGAYPLSRLRLAPRAHPRSRAGALSDIAAGIREVWSVRRLRELVLLVMFNGVLFIGPFIVVFPLLIRDRYQGDIAQLGVVNMLFALGTITGSVALLRRGGIRRKGRALLLGLFGGGLCLLCVGVGLPLWGMMAAVFAWGLCGAVFFSASRTLVQAAAPHAHRARVLSIYALGVMGTGPIGALQAGFVAEALGPLHSCTASGVAMLVVVIAFWTASSVRRME